MKRLVCIPLLLFGLITAHAQQPVVTDATPAEAAAIQKAVPIIETALDAFNGPDWEKTNDFYSGDIRVNLKPAVPININCNFERDYRVTDNSDRANQLIKPLADKITGLAQQNKYDEVKAFADQVKLLSNLTVDVYINNKVTGINTPDNNGIKLNVKGADLCYKTKHDQHSAGANTYWLLFGNWSTATVGRHGLAFHFVHPPKTPYIENIAVVISGPDDRVQQLLQTVDWGQLHGALTL